MHYSFRKPAILWAGNKNSVLAPSEKNEKSPNSEFCSFSSVAVLVFFEQSDFFSLLISFACHDMVKGENR